MSWVAVGVTAASVAVSLYQGQQQKKLSEKEGQQRQKAAEFEASALETNATQTIATAQRNMIDAQRVAKVTESRAQALAAASGGGATSPTALKVVADIAREGSYNSARALYQGEEAARMMRLEAMEKRETGQFDLSFGQAKGKSYEMQSFGTALGTGGGLYAKYGGRGSMSSGGVSGSGAGGLNWDTTGGFEAGPTVT